MEKCSKVGSPVKQWTFQGAKGGQSVIQHLIPFSTTPGWPPFLGSSILALLGCKKTHTLLYIHSLLLQAAPTKRNYPPGQNFVWVVEVCFPRASCPSETWLIEIRISLVVPQSPSRVRVFATPWTAACQASLSLSVPKFTSIALVMSFSHPILWHPLLLPSIFPSIRVFSYESPFASGEQNTGASASISVLPMNIQGWFPLGLTGWSPCCPRNSQDINSLALCLHSSALTTVHDRWEDHSLD